MGGIAQEKGRLWVVGQPAFTAGVAIRSGGGRLFLESKGDVAGVAAGMLDQDFSVASLHDVGKFFAPFHQEDGVLRGEFIKAYGFQLALVFNAVEVDVVELELVVLAVHFVPSVVFVNQRKGGAGHFIRIGGIECLGNSLDQSGLTCAEVSAQKEQGGRCETAGY